MGLFLGQRNRVRNVTSPRIFARYRFTLFHPEYSKLSRLLHLKIIHPIQSQKPSSQSESLSQSQHFIVTSLGSETSHTDTSYLVLNFMLSLMMRRSKGRKKLVLMAILQLKWHFSPHQISVNKFVQRIRFGHEIENSFLFNFHSSEFYRKNHVSGIVMLKLPSMKSH